MAKDTAAPAPAPAPASAPASKADAAALARHLPVAKYDGAKAASRAAEAKDVLSFAAVPGSRTKFRVVTSAGARLIVDTTTGETHPYRIGVGGAFERPVAQPAPSPAPEPAKRAGPTWARVTP